jgi:hypothetical protein
VAPSKLVQSRMPHPYNAYSRRGPCHMGIGTGISWYLGVPLLQSMAVDCALQLSPFLTKAINSSESFQQTHRNHGNTEIAPLSMHYIPFNLWAVCVQFKLGLSGPPCSPRLPTGPQTRFKASQSFTIRVPRSPRSQYTLKLYFYLFQSIQLDWTLARDAASHHPCEIGGRLRTWAT